MRAMSRGRGGEDGHQPGAGGVLHPGADGGDGGGDPAVAEEGDGEGLEAGDEWRAWRRSAAAGAVSGEERGTEG